MFSYLKLENFKSFKKIEIDFRGKKRVPKNMIFIYGENGAGKSNLVYAFQFLRETMSTLNFQNKLSNWLENIKNESSENTLLLENISRSPFYLQNNLNKIKENAAMIGSTDDMIVELGFYLNKKEGIYKLVFGDSLKEESLYYQLDKNRGFMFKLTDEKKVLSKKVFFDSEYHDYLIDSIEKYWGKHTFLSILDNEIQEKNYAYLQKRVDSNFFKVMDFFMQHSIKCKSGKYGETGIIGTKYKALLDLEKGKISLKEGEQLLKKEKLIRSFLTSFYSDIKDVYYDKKIDSENKTIEYKLYLKKIIGGELRDIDFSLESTGTQNLLDILLPLVESSTGNTSIIDEADAGIHDILFNAVIESISDSIEGQLIVTTHNTTLLERLNKENIYFILVDDKGNKEIVNVNNFDERTQATHNIRERYLKGMYGGVPLPGSFDFEDIFELLQNKKESGDNRG